MERRLTLQIDTATTELADALAEVAARTFPLACPPSSTSEDIDAFIAENLSADRFARYLTDPDRTVLAARRDGRILGYAMTVRGVPDDPDVQRAVPLRPAIELSKMYVLPDCHGAGVSAALMDAVVRYASAQHAPASGWGSISRTGARNASTASTDSRSPAPRPSTSAPRSSTTM